MKFLVAIYVLLYERGNVIDTACKAELLKSH